MRRDLDVDGVDQYPWNHSTVAHLGASSSGAVAHGFVPLLASLDPCGLRWAAAFVILLDIVKTPFLPCTSRAFAMMLKKADIALHDTTQGER